MRGSKAWSKRALLLVATMVACGPQGPPLPPSVPVLPVVMREFAFGHPDEIPRGRVIFSVVNRGRIPHRAALIPLPEDFPPLDEQLAGSERRGVSEQGMVPNRAPGERDAFAVDLAAGRYALVCFVVDPGEDRTHAQKGMFAEFRVA